jgi:putative ABC transport system permease protein
MRFVFFLTAIKISYKNLLGSKLRSFLTILGIIIGVAAVVIIFAIGKSAQEVIVGQIKGVGTNLIAVLPGASKEDGPPAMAFGITVKTLTLNDLESLLAKADFLGIDAATGYVFKKEKITYQSLGSSFNISGVTADYPVVEDGKLLRGRFFDKEEGEDLTRVAVLGSGVAKEFFGNDDPIGKKITIKNHNFQVIGVFREKGASAFGANSQDDSVFIPIKTSQKLIMGIDHLGFIRLKAKNATDIPWIKEEIKQIIRINHNIKDSQEDDFSVRDQASALKIITNVTDILRYFLLAIGSISLLVGGVGIMNIMLIAVNQRIREVGLRKAVGARSEDIASQFLVESAVVSLLGGIAGIIIGILFSFIISLIMQALKFEWNFFLSPLAILLAMLISVLVGLVFGMYPAIKASRISPMEALRYE